jgi:hypothetical protein
MSIERQNNSTPPADKKSELVNNETPKHQNLLPSGEHIIVIPNQRFLTYDDFQNRIKELNLPSPRSTNAPSRADMEYGEQLANMTAILPIKLANQILFLVSNCSESIKKDGTKQMEYKIQLFPNSQESTYLPRGVRFCIYETTKGIDMSNSHQDRFLGDIMEINHLRGPDGKAAEIEVRENECFDKIFCTFSDEDSQKFGIPKSEQGSQYQNGVKVKNGFDMRNIGYEVCYQDENDKTGKKIIKHQIIYNKQIVGYAYSSDPNRFLETISRNADNFMQFEFSGKINEAFHVAIAIDSVNPETGKMETFATIVHAPDILANPAFTS